MVVQSLDLVADLKLQNENIGYIYVVTGLNTPGDNQGGIFWWNASSTLPNDNVDVIQVTGTAVGRWLRITDDNNSVPSSRTVTINGVTQNLSANRTYNVGTVTSVSALTLGTTGTDLSSTVATSTTTPVITLNVPTASGTNRGALSSADWITFNSKQNAITLTTTGSSGASTFISNILNVPTYTLSGLGGVPSSRTLTINGSAFDLSADRTYSVGTVTSVNMTVPTGLTISGNPITSAGTLAIALASGFSIPTTASQATWDSAYNDKINSAAVTGTATKTLTLNQQDGGTVTATWSDIDTGLTSVGLSMPSAFSVSNSPLTSNGTIAVSGGGTALQYINGLGGLATFPLGLPPTGTAGGDLTGTYPNPTVHKIHGEDFQSGVPTANDVWVYGGPPNKWQHQQLNTNQLVNGANFITLASLSATSPLVYTSGAFSITQATTSVNGFLSATDFTTFNNKQIAGNYITALTGEVTASGPGSVAATLLNSAVIGKVLTGLNLSGGGTIANTDTILQAFGKTQNQISALVGGVNYDGVWNATTNTPAIVSSVGSKGDYYVVNVAGSTSIDGINDWKVGDWIIFNGTVWDKVDNTDAVSSVNSFVGAVSLTTANISEVTNLYYLDSRARASISFIAGSGAYNSSTGAITIPTNNNQIANGSSFITLTSISAGTGISYSNTTGIISNTITQYTDALARASISLTTTGTSGAATYNNSTGVLNVPNYANVVTSVFGRTGAVVATSGDYNTLLVTENTNLYYTEARVNANTNVSANTAARHNALTISTANGLSLSTQALSLALASTSVTGALSSTDFTTFNNKQATISLTTTGTSGAATFSANTLNIPQYQGVLTNPVTGTGTTNFLPKFTGASTIGNSQIFDNGTNVGIGTTSPASLLHIGSATNFTVPSRTTAVYAGSDSETIFTVGRSGVDYPQLLDFGVNQLQLYSTISARQFTTNENKLILQPNGGNVGIGTINPYTKLQVSALNSSFNNLTGGFSIVKAEEGYGMYFGVAGTGTSWIQSGSYNNSITYPLALNSAGGNVLIGTTIDAGFKLDVNGTARVTGALTITNGRLNLLSNTGDSKALMLVGDATFPTFTLIAPNVGGTILIAGQSGTGMTIGTSGAATFSSSVTIDGVLQETITANRQTSSYTLVLTDRGKLVEMNIATANNLTVPLNSSVAFPIGTKIDVSQYGAGQTTLIATSGVTVRSAGGALKLALQYSGASLVKIGANEWYLFGDITV